VQKLLWRNNPLVFLWGELKPLSSLCTNRYISSYHDCKIGFFVSANQFFTEETIFFR
jgi:hypothetical protein